MKKDLMTGAILVAEAVAAAGALSALNVAKGNTNRGTYAIGANKETGKGGVDLDIALGAALVLGAAFAPAGIAPHLAALGVGGLATAGARMGAKYGASKAPQMSQTAAGMPGHGYLRGFDQRYLPSAPDPFVSRFGFHPTAAGERAVAPLYDHAHFPGAHRF
jgi:hypothetical protein